MCNGSRVNAEHVSITCDRLNEIRIVSGVRIIQFENTLNVTSRHWSIVTTYLPCKKDNTDDRRILRRKTRDNQRTEKKKKNT